ncbi:FAD assembly factor SdhE [Albidovulum sp.]
MTEAAETRLRRLAMRSRRRGTREMDLILGAYAEARLAGLDSAALDRFESLLAENDQDLYAWISGAEPPPADRVALIAEIAAFARDRHRPDPSKGGQA